MGYTLEKIYCFQDTVYMCFLTDLVSARTWTPLREYCVWWSQEIVMSTDRTLWGWSLFLDLFTQQLHLIALFLFVHNFIFLIVKGNVKNSFINTTRSVIASCSLSHFHLNPQFRHLYHHTPWVMSSHPTWESPSAPLNSCRLFPCLNVIKPSLISLLPIWVQTAWGSLITGFSAIFVSPASASSPQ